MNRSPLLPLVAAMLAAASALPAQAVLRAAPSTQATSEVTLSYPRPAAPAAGAAATPAAPAAKPLVIRLDYGQPHLRGRALHTDSLVPYDKPWRTGANSHTTLTTDVDLVLGGVTVPKGKYLLYTIPGRTAWKMVVQRDVGQNPGQYADSNDVARIDLRHSSAMHPVESLTMWLVPSLDAGPARGELRFAWGTDQLSTTWSIK